MNKFFKLGFFSIMLLTLINYNPTNAKSCCPNSSYSSCCSKSSSSSCDEICNKYQECTKGSRTILVPRSQTLDAMNELALNNYFLYHNTPDQNACPFIHTQISYFHKSSNNECDLRRYFLKNNANSMTVRENGTGDIASLWLNVIAPTGASFQSDITINPRRKIDGGYFNFWADLNNYICGGWAAISFAAYRSEARMGFRETRLLNPGTIPGFQTATQGFRNLDWRYGKLSDRCHVRHGVDDVQFKLGWNHYFCNNDHAGLYLVAVAPTGKCGDRQNDENCRRNRKDHCGEYIWDPYIGSRHAGFGFGINTDKTLWECENQGLNWMMDLKYIYRFKNQERRLFDLRANGDYSRYLQVVTPRQRQNSLPAVNFFNQRVQVKPKSLVEFWTALHWEWCMFNVEAGYNLFWRAAERVCLTRDKCGNANNLRDNQIGIYDITGDCRRNPVSASRANISQTVAGTNVAPSDATFTYVNRRDLDLRSGAQPSALTNTIYLGASYNSELCCLPTMIGISGSYEFASNHFDCRSNCNPVSNSCSEDCNVKNRRHKNKNKDRAAIEQWGIALKGDIAF